MLVLHVVSVYCCSSLDYWFLSCLSSIHFSPPAFNQGYFYFCVEELNFGLTKNCLVKLFKILSISYLLISQSRCDFSCVKLCYFGSDLISFWSLSFNFILVMKWYDSMLAPFLTCIFKMSLWFGYSSLHDKFGIALHTIFWAGWC